MLLMKFNTRHIYINDKRERWGDYKGKTTKKQRVKRSTTLVDSWKIGRQGKDNNLTWSRLLCLSHLLLKILSLSSSCTRFPIRATLHSSGDQSRREAARGTTKTCRELKGNITQYTERHLTSQHHKIRHKKISDPDIRDKEKDRKQRIKTIYIYI